MKYIVKDDCSLALPEEDKYRGVQGYLQSRLNLEKCEVYEIKPCKIKWYDKIFSYMLYKEGDTSNCYNTRKFLLDDDIFERHFRLPTKDHWQVKLCTEPECNEFLKTIGVDCLKDIKMTDNLLMVIYKVKGEK